jgi:glycosyltransferase involved in cell wall biosynthesis
MPNNTQPGIEYLQERVKSVSVIIPCKNEDKSISITVNKLDKMLGELEIDYEIIVVDDGSTDATQQEALSAGARVLVHDINMGYGNSIMDGIMIAKYPVIAILDGDSTYPISMLPVMIEKASSHDMVIGARSWSQSNTSLLGRFLRKSLYYLILYFTDHRVPDYNSGLRVFHRHDLLNYRPVLCPTFSFTTSLTLLYLLSARSVFFIEIEYLKRVGHSKVSYFRDAIRTFSYVFIIASLFQPYRLAIMLIFIGCILNGLIMVCSPLFHFSSVVGLGLYITASLAVLVSAISLSVYPVAKLFLSHMQGQSRL